MKPSYLNSIRVIAAEVLQHPIRSTNLHRSIPQLLKGLTFICVGLYHIFNALLSMVFRTVVFIAFPATLPLLALIHYWAVSKEEASLEYHAELTKEEKTELGI